MFERGGIWRGRKRVVGRNERGRVGTGSGEVRLVPERGEGGYERREAGQEFRRE